MIIKILTTVIASFMLALPLQGQAMVRDTTIKVSCFFPVSSSESRIEDMAGFMDFQDVMCVKSVTVQGWASPEGSSSLNARLSEERARAMADSLRFVFSVDSVSVLSGGVDWDGFRDRLSLLEESDSLTAGFASVITGTPLWVRDSKGVIIDGRVARLKRYEGGRLWDKSSERIFPYLRRVDVEMTIVRYMKSAADTIALMPVAEPEAEELLPVVVPVSDSTCFEPVEESVSLVTESDIEKPFRVLVYSNLLYDFGLLPNIGTVLHLGSGWAVDARWGYTWLSNNEKHFYWRAYGGEFAVRKYLDGPSDDGRGPWRSLTGHHFGIYGQFFTYDVELGGHGQIGGEPNMNIFKNPQYGAGLEYGYTFPLSDCLNLDLSIGAGYVGGIYHEYEPFYDKYMWLTTYKRNWFGPTRVDVTLQWLIGGAKRRAEK